MTMDTWIGRGAVLSIGIGFSLSACQSIDLSSKGVPVGGLPENGTEDAIADLTPTTLSDPQLLTNAPLPVPAANGSKPNSGDTSITVPETVGLTKDDSSDQSSALGLANHLTMIGAQMFGAYWCPHCQEQKKKFGDAFSAVDYVECDPGGEAPQTQLCLESEIEAFPTWVINGEHHLGVHSLEELAELSGYEEEV